MTRKRLLSYQEEFALLTSANKHRIRIEFKAGKSVHALAREWCTREQCIRNCLKYLGRVSQREIDKITMVHCIEAPLIH